MLPGVSSPCRRPAFSGPILALEIGAVATSRAEGEKAREATFLSLYIGNVELRSPNSPGPGRWGGALILRHLEGGATARRHQPGTCQHGRWRQHSFRGRPWGFGFRSSGGDRAGAPAGR